jgi:hypothetical protein
VFCRLPAGHTQRSPVTALANCFVSAHLAEPELVESGETRMLCRPCEKVRETGVTTDCRELPGEIVAVNTRGLFVHVFDSGGACPEQWAADLACCQDQWRLDRLYVRRVLTAHA